MRGAMIRALLWERWRQTRFLVLAVYAIESICWLGLMASPFPAQFRLVSGFVWWFSPPLLAIGLTATQIRVNDIRLGLPGHCARLPVPTSLLVNTHLGYNVLVLLVSMLLSLLAIHDLVYKTSASLMSDQITFAILYFFVMYVLFTIASFTMHGTIWLQPQSPPYRVIAIALLVFCLSLAATVALIGKVLVGAGPFAIAKKFMASDVSIAILLVTLLIASYCFAYKCASLNRRGKGLSLGRLAVLLKFRIFKARIKPFRSPYYAQAWFEFRRLGIYCPSIASAICIIAVVQLAYLGVIGKSITVRDLLNQLANTTVLLAAIVAHGFIVRTIDGERLGRQTQFFLAKPLTTAQLAYARFRSVLAGFLIAVIVCSVTNIGVTLYSMHEGISPGSRIGSRPEILLNVMERVVVVSAGAWIVLHYGVHLLFSIGLVWITSLGLARPLLDFDSPVYGGAMVLFVALTLLGLARIARIRRLFNSAALFKLMIVWILCAIACTLAVRFGIAGLDLNPIRVLHGIIAYAGLLAAPLVTMPLWIDRLRHR